MKPIPAQYVKDDFEFYEEIAYRLIDDYKQFGYALVCVFFLAVIVFFLWRCGVISFNVGG
jgi:hypothetical protein